MKSVDRIAKVAFIIVCVGALLGSVWLNCEVRGAKDRCVRAGGHVVPPEPSWTCEGAGSGFEP